MIASFGPLQPAVVFTEVQHIIRDIYNHQNTQSCSTITRTMEKFLHSSKRSYNHSRGFIQPSERFYNNQRHSVESSEMFSNNQRGSTIIKIIKDVLQPYHFTVVIGAFSKTRKRRYVNNWMNDISFVWYIIEVFF